MNGYFLDDHTSLLAFEKYEAGDPDEKGVPFQCLVNCSERHLLEGKEGRTIRIFVVQLNIGYPVVELRYGPPDGLGDCLILGHHQEV